MSGQAGAADAENGEYLFKTICAACHSIEPDSHRTGPSLHKIWGHPAGKAEGFDYSAAFKGAAADELIWTEENLDKFLRRPRSVVKGNKMAYLGLRDDADRADLLAYLKRMSQ
ncbi:c-type cytochrome [Hwanghaeella grinnelliae]|uniref:C-type cytochrome n=2 Tax=Hwanghaeella grinnelliae TaxID=2500179 RepID=A0A437QL90_9PROT|nr:c-type cytochrome [Hwanghaeella grinnelliae]